MSRLLSLNKETLQTKLIEDNPEDFRLLKRAYQNIYLPAFPEAAHRERLADMIHYIKTNRPEADQEYLVLISSHISAEDYQRPVGIATANRLSNQNSTIAFFEHAAIHPSYRGQGLWSAITKARTAAVQQQAAQRNTGLAAIFAETEKPILTIEEQDLPLGTRSKLLKKRLERRELFRRIRFSEESDDKYYQLNFNYLQLPVRDSAQSISNLDLVVRVDPQQRQEYLSSGIPGALLSQWLQMYFNSFEVSYNFREHPEFIKMKSQLKENIALLPIT